MRLPIRCAPPAVLSFTVALALALAALMTRAPTAAAAEAKSPPLAASATPLLGGRITARLAPDMKLEARGHDIMSAPAANEDETRAFMDKGETRFVMMVWELYARVAPDADFAAAVKSDLAQSGLAAPLPALETVALKAPLGALAVAPPAPVPPRDGNIVYQAYVKDGTGAVMLLAFYLSPDGLKDAAAWTALARAIVASIEAGPRALAATGGTASFAGAAKDKLLVDLPAGFVSATQDGPDFSVYRVRQIVGLGEPQPVCGIYVGGHPSYQHSQRDIPAASVTQVEGALLGKAATWHVWTAPGEATSEAIIAHPLAESLRLHVFCSGATPAARDAIQKVLATLRVQP